MTFLTERRFFSKKVTLFPLSFFFEFLLLNMLGFITFITWPELISFVRRSDQVIADPDGIAVIGLLGLYGARISMFVAVIRKNRMPQTIEWWCTLIGLAMLIAWPLDGTLLRLYASLHGYEFCRELPGGKVTHDLFVLHGHPCPG